MIITCNGYVSFLKRTEGGGFDEHGNPISAASLWCEPMPCNYRNITEELQRRKDADLIPVTVYKILCDYPEEDVRLTKRVQLFTPEMEMIGEFAVSQSERKIFTRHIETITRG